MSLAKIKGVGAVRGHVCRLDETRLVFVGKSADHPDTWFVGFRNAAGEDTKLVLSDEAWAALMKLAAEPSEGSSPFPHKTAWRLVIDEADGGEINDV